MYRVTRTPLAESADSQPPFICGVDGCRAGWVVASVTANPSGPHHVQIHIVSRLADDPALLTCACVGIDMPIGLPSTARPAARRCDRLARELLSPTRSASIFSPPCREVLGASDYKAALVINRAVLGVGISKQAYNIVPKIAELDTWLATLSAPSRGRIVEVHPELSFLHLARKSSGDLKALPPPPKKTAAGHAARLSLLQSGGLASVNRSPVSLSQQITALRRGRARDFAVDDVLDALAAAWSALRHARGESICLPGERGRDERGLLMQIVV